MRMIMTDPRDDTHPHAHTHTETDRQTHTHTGMHTPAYFESDDRSIFIQRPGVEEANLPDVFEHWTLHEYVELAFLRAARGSIRRHNLQAVLLWIEGQESTEADFAFGLMNESTWISCGL